jgi:citrate lyase subunit beta/citryl-CoA lyase
VRPDRPALRSLAVLDARDPAATAQAEAPDAVILACDPTALAAADFAALMTRARDRAARRHVVVRLSPLASGRVDAELDALRAAWPDAVLLPGCAGAGDLQQCAVKLGVREAEAGVPAGRTAIIAEPGAAGVLALAEWRGASERLAALTWDGTALETDLGAAPGLLGAQGDATATSVLRMLLLLGARGAGVAAYDAPQEMGVAAFGEDCRRAKALGFNGRVTRDARQIATINAVFAARGLSEAG